MATVLPKWTAGIKDTLKRNNAHLPELYSWHGIDDDGKFVFITEADHRNKNSSIVNLKEGWVQRNIDAAQPDWAANSQRHSAEVFSAVKLAFEKKLPVKVLLTRYSKYSTQPNRAIKAMMPPWDFEVVSVKGESAESGYSYRLERVGEIF